MEKSRYAALPDIPTVGETVPGFEMSSWHGIFAPAATRAADCTAQRRDPKRARDRRGERKVRRSRGRGGDQHAGGARRYRQERSCAASSGRQHPAGIARAERRSCCEQSCLRSVARAGTGERPGAGRRRLSQPAGAADRGRRARRQSGRAGAAPLAEALRRVRQGLRRGECSGAGGVVAAKMVAATPPDGHVLMLGDSGAMAINVVLNPDLGYDPLKDFTPITALVTVPTVLVVHPSVPARTLQEFIAYARSKPGQLAYGSAGPGSIHHLTMAIFAAQTGIDLLHVPYRGGTALVGPDQRRGAGRVVRHSQRLAADRGRQASRPVHQHATALEVGCRRADRHRARRRGLRLRHHDGPAGVGGSAARSGRALAERGRQGAARAGHGRSHGRSGHGLRENGTADYVKFMRDDIERYRTAIKTFKLQIN